MIITISTFTKTIPTWPRMKVGVRMPSEGAGQRGRAAQLLVLPVTEAEGSVCGIKPFYSASTADTSTGAEVEFQPMGGGSRVGRHQPSERGTEGN